MSSASLPLYTVGYRLALAHPFALADLMAHGAAFTGEDLLVPDQPAADVDGVLGGALIDQRGGEGVRQGKIALCGEVQRNGRQQGDAEKAENTGVVHGSSLVECWDASLGPDGASRAPPAARRGEWERWWK